MHLRFSVLLAAVTAHASIVPASSPLFLYQGRSRDVNGSRAFDWEGWQAELTLTGASFVSVLLSVPVGVSNWFRVFIDDAPLATRFWVNSSADSYPVVTAALPPGPHSVRLYNTNEPCHSGTAHAPFVFHGFETDGAVAQSAPRRRRLELVGDSQLAGSGDVGTPPCNGTLQTTDHSVSWGPLLCAALGANCSYVAYSGRGVYQNCCDATPAAGEKMPALWRQTFGGPAWEWDWDFSRFVPDAVVVALGTNDILNGHDTGPAWEAGFCETYLSFLVNVTAVYGAYAGRRAASAAPIPLFLGVGPITAAIQPLVEWVVGNATALGLNVTYLDLMGCDAAAGCGGCAGHPDAADNAAVAALALPVISRVMGW